MLVANSVHKFRWLAKSLDLNPIDHLLDLLKRKVCAQPLQLNLRELTRVIHQMCAAIPQSYIHWHILSMRTRFAVDAISGGCSKYWNEIKDDVNGFCSFCFKGVHVTDLYFCRFCVVIRFFHPRHNGQWPLTLKDFYTRSYPLHYFLILILEKEPVFPFSMLSAKQGHYWYHFYNVFVWRGPWLGIESGTSRTRSQHSTTRLSRRPSNAKKCTHKNGPIHHGLATPRYR